MFDYRRAFSFSAWASRFWLSNREPTEFWFTQLVVSLTKPGDCFRIFSCKYVACFSCWMMFFPVYLNDVFPHLFINEFSHVFPFDCPFHHGKFPLPRYPHELKFWFCRSNDGRIGLSSVARGKKCAAATIGNGKQRMLDFGTLWLCQNSYW
jgi:hypothetical protein